MKENYKIIIIGAGLSGLTLAYLLKKRNIKFTILEASPRFGGRIQTLKGKLSTPLELGATWFSDLHSNLLALITELELQKYHQFYKGISLFQTNSFEPPQKFMVPESDQPSYRLAGGTQILIDTLAQQIGLENIILNSKVCEITEPHTDKDKLLVKSNDGKIFETDKVILCLPPQLIGAKIRFSPQLTQVLSTMLPSVQTWMGGSIKFVLEFDTPFWRDRGFSVMLYSHTGIVTEMYDHTNFEVNKYGFTGFLNGATSSYPSDVRQEMVLKQLTELLGEEALCFVKYEDKVWTNEFVFLGNQNVIFPHKNNGHPLLQKDYFNGKLFFCSTETSTAFPGYMEGAIIAAKKTANAISL